MSEAKAATPALELTDAQIKQFYQVARFCLSKRPFLQHLPFLLPSSRLEEKLLKVAVENHFEFSWSVCFDVDFIAQLMYHGFLTMCEKIQDGCYVLFPKLHHERCVLSLPDLHISKRNRKHASKFSFSTNKAFKKVCDGIIKQHGENWFYPPLVEAFVKFNQRGDRGGYGGKVKMYSIEVWDSDNNLVAGEIGYAIGASYTSLSGFATVSSSGSVQLLVLGVVLRHRGFELWDLGMGMDYKSQLGAKEINRLDFVSRLCLVRDKTVEILDVEKTNAREVINRSVVAPNPVCAEANPMSKKQRKRQLKRELKEAKRLHS